MLTLSPYSPMNANVPILYSFQHAVRMSLHKSCINIYSNPDAWKFTNQQSTVKFVSSRTEFVSSRTEFVSSRTEFVSSRTEFVCSRTEFVCSRTDILINTRLHQLGSSCAIQYIFYICTHAPHICTS